MRLDRILPPIWTLAAFGCGSGDLVLPSGTSLSQVVIVQGDQQEAVAGAPVDDSLVVQVVDTAGLGEPGQAVTWIVSIGGGEVEPRVTTTDAPPARIEPVEGDDQTTAAGSLVPVRPAVKVSEALSDQLPELGPHGPEPFLFSLTFEVK